MDYKVAYICEPYLGGLYTFFLEMRPALAKLGVRLDCVAPYPSGHYQPGVAKGHDGVLLIDQEPPEAGKCFSAVVAEHLERHDYRAVIVVPGNSEVSNVLPAILDRSIVTIGFVPHNGRGVYQPVSRVAGHLDWIVGVNQLLHDDLVDKYKVDPAKVCTIFTGLDMAGFQSGDRSKREGPLNIVFTSRLEDLQKNVLILPDIIHEAIQLGVRVRLQVLCGGPDEEKLRQKFERLGIQDHVELSTNISRAEMLSRLANADVFLLTSRFEGCPHALIEAMASGCVPVVSNLRGITDTMLGHGVEGFLCALDKPDEFARCLRSLADDPEHRRKMGMAARARALRQFDIMPIAKSYCDLFCRGQPSLKEGKLSPDEAMQTYVNIAPARWRAWIPAPVKKVFRTYMAKRGRSV